MTSPADKLFRFGTLVPEVWRNTAQRQQNEELFAAAFDEVMTLKRVLVYADKLLMAYQDPNGFFPSEDQEKMRADIDKAISYTLRDK